MDANFHNFGALSATTLGDNVTGGVLLNAPYQNSQYVGKWTETYQDVFVAYTDKDGFLFFTNTRRYLQGSDTIELDGGSVVTVAQLKAEFIRQKGDYGSGDDIESFLDDLFGAGKWSYGPYNENSGDNNAFGNRDTTPKPQPSSLSKYAPYLILGIFGLVIAAVAVKGGD